MNKADLISHVSQATNVGKLHTKRVIDAFIKTIIDALTTSDQSVQIKDFGVFKVKSKLARMGRNPATGEAIEIPASRTIKFQMARSVKDKM